MYYEMLKNFTNGLKKYRIYTYIYINIIDEIEKEILGWKELLILK